MSAISSDTMHFLGISSSVEDQAFTIPTVDDFKSVPMDPILNEEHPYMVVPIEESNIGSATLRGASFAYMQTTDMGDHYEDFHSKISTEIPEFIKIPSYNGVKLLDFTKVDKAVLHIGAMAPNVRRIILSGTDGTSRSDITVSFNGIGKVTVAKGQNVALMVQKVEDTLHLYRFSIDKGTIEDAFGLPYFTDLMENGPTLRSRI